MDYKNLSDSLVPLIRQNLLPLILGFLGVILLGYGVIGLLVSSSNSNDIAFEKASQSSEVNSGNKKDSQIVVDIEGAVVSPGVYNLPKESRVKDVLVAARGLSSGADRNWVAKNLNLALKVTDGIKIYIPFEGETFTSSQVQGGASIQSGGLININTASDKELDTLSGIGPATASKIIQGRPYQTIDDLLSKKIVGSSVFDKIKDKITIY
ncbi:MAG: hypothetical protein A2958_00185 [Candidatus Levybacteria bacterium RIFCSPLOWO2_01_FULL_38_13]|nr:MAG: hypothetical protein A2629_02270 [Candidatus Levybacteria bacterium RIFCSPHIGHO2_01_FULL_41_15]OGH34958.1 MAG: hypothetical protein A2958_00185 [Candidatus Levybacteria bacterium RIFCSPLOWO2_01_FULL_38_13]